MNQAHEETQPRTAPPAPLILVIDDCPGIRNLLRAVLGPTYRVLCAANVDDAFALAALNHPDLVITDYEMPGKTGLDGVREMRRQNPRAAIIMLSGSASRDIVEDALREGVGAFLTKPFRLDELRQCVRQQIAQSAMGTAVAPRVVCSP